MERVIDLFGAAALRAKLDGRRIALCYGGGVDSTAMLIALHDAGLRPDVITFADTGGEKPETLEHVRWTDSVLAKWGWPSVSWVRHNTLASTSYNSLGGNCAANETLPSLAFGMKSCSVKWKLVPQDQFLMGVLRGPNKRPAHPLWLETQAAGVRIVKLIGYDAGKADVRRSKNLSEADENFDYAYPLQLLGWTRGDCVAAIVADPDFGPSHVPIKSACYFCPASQKWELYWLAAHHPLLLENALAIEHAAMIGKHSRWGSDECTYDKNWEEFVAKPADQWPTTEITVGLGRSFAWNHWARVNNVVDATGKVRLERTEEFKALAARLESEAGNALDGRACGGGPSFKGIAIRKAG